jgi:methionyl-tRNA formyltransferase
VPLKIIFCGTPAFAVPSLVRLAAESDFSVAGVVTQPDRPAGRAGAMKSSPVKLAAQERGIPVFQPERIRSEESLRYFQRAGADVVVIIAYGQIISEKLIAVPRLGWINVHGSLLPKYRGAAPIHWAIANGETHTGLTTMQIDRGLDTGPTLQRYETQIAPNETSPDLYERLADAAAPLIVETLRGLAAGKLTPVAQDNSQATFAPVLNKEDGRIDWSRTSSEIYNRMRGFQPWPGAFSTFRGKLCAIWGKPAAETFPDSHEGSIVQQNGKVLVACGQSTSLQLETAQIEGRKHVTAREFANGARLAADEIFGT